MVLRLSGSIDIRDRNFIESLNYKSELFLAVLLSMEFRMMTQMEKNLALKAMPNNKFASSEDTEELFVYVNGKLLGRKEATVSVWDHGLLYGDGVFEGIREYNGTVFKLKEHIDRLYESAHYIRLKIPMTKEQMSDAVLETLRQNKLRNAYIRLLVTRGVGDLGLNPTNCANPSIVIITEPTTSGEDPTSKPIGVSAIISSIRRDPVDATSHEVKSLNYLNSILARWEAIDAGVSDAVMLDTQGFVSEATAENIFIFAKGQLVTPSIDSAILHGVTRQRVIEIAEDLGYVIAERRITPFELINAEEVFMTGTLAEIVPVLKVNGRNIGGGKVGSVTARIFGEFAKLRSQSKEGTPVYPDETNGDELRATLRAKQ
jgi:branched-chain amino acid aminotransferase